MNMILITEEGHRVLSTDLPYSVAEIAELMARWLTSALVR